MRAEAVERNKDGPLSTPVVLCIVSVCERKSWQKKIIVGPLLILGPLFNLNLYQFF